VYIAFQIVTVSSLMAAATIVQAQQYPRPVPPAFSRSAHGRGVVGSLELEPHQTVPQPFRRVSLPLYRGRGFSVDGQEPKPTATSQTALQQTFLQPRLAAPPTENDEELNRAGNGEGGNDAAEVPRPTTGQQRQIDRGQQQQADRTQQQQQPGKQFAAFRPQVHTQYSLLTLLYSSCLIPRTTCAGRSGIVVPGLVFESE